MAGRHGSVRGSGERRRAGARGGRARSALAAVLLALTASAPAAADWWSENFEAHGFLTTKAYVVSPNFSFGDEVWLNSWRTEFNLETELRLHDSRNLSVTLFGIFRPIYEAIYDIDDDRFGKNAHNGRLGALQAGDPLNFFANRATARDSQTGRSFPGHGARFPGLFTATNADLVTEIAGQRFPAYCHDTVVFLGCVPAAIRPRGSKQPKIGGTARPSTFIPLQLRYLSENLDTTITTATMQGLLDGPLSRLGSSKSFKQSPVDINRNEDELKFECFDNAHPWCFVRELYAEIEWGDTLIRLGKQQVVWGKTDVFRMQDIVNPLDLGIHNVLPPLEEGTIPQLALDVIHSFGDVGPLEDFSVEFVWNFDRFLPIQVGQCGEPYSWAFGCEARADALGHGILNLGVAEAEERAWKFGNTEVGFRIEFRTRKPSIAWSISGYWGFQDLPALEYKERYSTTNPNVAALMAVQGLLPELVSRQSATSPQSVEQTLNSVNLGVMDPAFCDPIVPIAACGFDPFDPVSIQTASDNLLALFDTLLLGAACPPPVNSFGPDCFPTGSVSVLGLTFPATAIQAAGLPWATGAAVIKYPRIFTLGGSLDYQIPRTDTILRLESALEFDRVLINTAKVDWQDDSNVVKAAIGLDRFTFIPFLNKNRAAFVSAQTFVEHIIDYSDGRGYGDGMVQDEYLMFSTFFMQNYWRNDSLILTTIFAYDWGGRSWVYAPTFRWIINESWFVDVGLNMFGGRKQEHNLRDLCVDGSTNCLADPRLWNPGNWQITNLDLKGGSETALGWLRESFADRYSENRDEIWIGITYQF